MTWFRCSSGGPNPEADLLNEVVSKTVTDLSSSVITSVGNKVFYDLQTLENVDLPNATAIGSESFRYCAHLQTINLPSVTSFGNYSFSDCTNLSGDLYFPNLTSAGQESLARCHYITSVNLPLLATIPYGFCKDNQRITTADLGCATFITQQSFWACGSFNTLIIRTNQVCTLEHEYALDYYTPFMSGKAGGTIYVPQALISSYQSATNWDIILAISTNQILPIEGSPYEQA